jgi:hypothetical protein
VIWGGIGGLWWNCSGCGKLELTTSNERADACLGRLA